MWFNNRLNEDNTIHFEVNEWICTDPDEVQFCRKVSDTEFEYIQLKDKARAKHTKHALSDLNDCTFITDWYQSEIDVTAYDADEIADYLAPYGGILDGCTSDSSRNQLIAECIFETDLIMGNCE